MKKVFTKNQLINSLLVLAFALISNGIYAQYQLEVNSPAGVAGTYEVLIANFGDLSGSEVTGDAAISANLEGCTAGGAVTGTTGFIAFIDRGTCGFAEKCVNAMADQAIAVVVCTPNDTLIAMGPGTEDVSSVTIPCVMMKGSDCDVLKVEIAGGLNATLKQNTDCDLSGVSYPSNVIWGSELGQGDFSGGLNGWEFDKGWKWTTRGQIDSGAYNTTIPFANGSMTWCTGVMVMDSDHLDNGGVEGGTDGDCRPTAFPEGFCDGVLTSPIMDISGATNIDGVVLQFTQSTRQYQSEYKIIYSADGGSTWIDTIDINTEYILNSEHFAGVDVQVPLAIPAGSTEVKVRFWYRGNYYYWAIDDVMLLNDASLDIAPVAAWASRAPYYEMPESQTGEIAFMADVENTGNADVPNANMTVTVVGPGPTLLHEDVMNYGDIAAGTTDENRVFEDIFQIPGVQGNYTLSYEMTGDGENTPENNIISTDFVVTKDRFSKISPDAQLSGWVPKGAGSNVNYTYGNIYHFPNDDADMELKTTLTGTKFEISVSDGYSGFVTAAFYEWIDIDSDGSAQFGERRLIAEYEEFVSDGDGKNGIYEVELEAVSGESLVLDLSGGSKTFILALNIAPGEGDSDYFVVSNNGRDGGGYEFSYEPIVYAFNELGYTRPHMVYAQGQDASDVDDRVFLTGHQLTPRLPLYLNIEDINGTEDVNNDIKASIFPNPVKDVVSIELNLTAVSKNVNVQLVNMEGKVVTDNDFKNVKNTTLTVDATNLPTGVYMANIRTAEGFIAKRVVVQK